jgi:cytochrome c5
LISNRTTRAETRITEDAMSDEAHSGPIKTPKQLLIAVLFSFLVPVFIIIALVAYVTAETKPAGSTDVASYSLGGVAPQDVERGVAERIRKVGMVEIRDANRALKSGEEVFKAQCTTCHSTGAAGAPKFGDAAAWANRFSKGFAALVESALKGKGAMPPQAGGDFEDTEVARAVAFMANAGGAKFAEPAQPAPSTTVAAAAVPVATAAVPAPAAVPAVATTAVATAAATAAPAAQTAAAGGAGEALYKQTCQVCHAAGVANAPKFGDKAAWAPRLAMGVAHLHESALKGKGAMPPKGGSAASDADVKAAVDYMVGAVK